MSVEGLEPRFRRSSGVTRRTAWEPEMMFSAGDVFSFRTTPFTEFSEPETGRYAAFKVLEASADLITAVVLDMVWTTPPSFEQARGAGVLHRQRFNSGGEPALVYAPTAWTPDLHELVLLGCEAPTEAESTIVPELKGVALWSTADKDAEGEWRWRHDHERVVVEVAKSNARLAEKRAEAERRYETRLKGLTWEVLLSETPFARWDRSPPFPPEPFTTSARALIYQTCRELRDLGQKPGKREVRAILRACVDWFNEEDERAGGVIETEEREDICEVLDELAFVAGQRGLSEEVARWRTW